MDSSINDCGLDEMEEITDDGLVDLDTPMLSGYQRSEIIEEIERCGTLETSSLRTELSEVINRHRQALPEVLVRLCRNAYKSGDRTTLNLAFEALAKTTVRLLLSQAWGLAIDERHQQAQEILLKIFDDIRNDKADFAETYFAAYARRRAIDLYRSRKATLEGSNIREEPADELDPIDDLPSRLPRHDYQALLSHALDKLPSNYRAVFIQYHQLEMTQEEIAIHYQVTVRTVFNWLKKAESAIGLSGDENER
jgi:RNA polymerase sigma factor (sigma-70 family)